MSEETTITILGKTYYIKCDPADLPSLKQAADYLQQKTREMFSVKKMVNTERMAVFTSLNLAHTLLQAEQQAHIEKQVLQQRLTDLQRKIESVLGSCAQMEFSPAES